MSSIIDSDESEIPEVCLTIHMMRLTRGEQGAGVGAPGEVPYGEYFNGRAQTE